MFFHLYLLLSLGVFCCNAFYYAFTEYPLSNLFFNGAFLIATVFVLFEERKRTLKESKKQNIIFNLFDKAPYGFFIFDKSANCVYYNQAAKTVFGTAKKKDFDSFLSVFSNDKISLSSIKSLSSKIDTSPGYVDISPVFIDGQYTSWRVWRAKFNEEFTAWYIHDITSNQKTSSGLCAYPSFLLDLLRHSPMGYIAFDKSNKVIFCNKTAQNIIDQDTSDLVDLSTDNLFVSGEEKEGFSEFNNNQVLVLTVRANLQKISLMALSEHNITGTKVYTVSKHLEESDIKNDQEIPGEEYAGNIFEDAPIGIAIINNMIVTAYNKTCEDIASDVLTVGSSVLNLTTEDKQDELKKAIYDTTNSSEANLSASLELPLCGNTDRVVVVYFHKLQDNKTISQGIILYIIDITERRQLEYKFSQSQKMQAIGQLAGGIAHDFNNLLTAMMGYCDLLLARYLPSDQSFNDIMQIKQNSNRAANLVKQLLAFSRQQVFQPKVLDVAEQLSELDMLLRRLIGPKVSLELNYTTAFRGTIKMDQTQFEQVIINLVVNAKDAMPEGGTLTIKTENITLNKPLNTAVENIPPNNYVMIVVKDTGSGIPREHIMHMFEPFFSTKEKGAGTGLGLSTVYGIIKQTGGFISIESKVGSGSIFKLYFPYHANQQKIEVEIKEENIPSASAKRIKDLTGLGKILLIEDDDAVRMFTARALRDKGYYIAEANNGSEGLNLLQNNNDMSLVISDIMMPLMDGLEFLKRLRKTNADINVMFISGYAEDKFRQRLQNEKKVHFLQKPFGIQELAGKVKNILFPD